MLSPHTGTAGFWLGGSYVSLKFDWEGLSRLQGRFGDRWLDELSQAVSDLDTKKMALAAECVAQTPIRLTPSFAAGLDDAAIVMATNLGACLGAAFAGPGLDPEGSGGEAADPDAPREAKPSEARWIEDAFATAVSAGIAPDTFWRLTPYETQIAVRGVSERLKVSQRQAIVASWYVEFFARQKKLPDLQTFFLDEDAPNVIPDDATPEQAVAILRTSLGDDNGRA